MENSNPEMKRVLRTKNEARLSYNRLSRWYDLLAASESKFIHAGLEKLDLEEGHYLLEIGSGTGRSLNFVSHYVGQTGRIFGVDLSDGMLACSQQQLDKNPLKTPVFFIQADGTRLPFERDLYDAVFLGFTLELFDTPELPDVLSQCRRVLRRNGRIGIVALERTKPPGISVLLYEWVRQFMPLLVDCRPIHTGHLLQSAGFCHIDIELRSMWGLSVAIACAANP